MSLIDLKRSNKNHGKKKSFTVDEFIEDAENYAQGKPEIVSSGHDNASAVKQALLMAQKEKQKQEKQDKKKRYRHATFTFNDKTVKQLNELAKSSNLAKSHILRILIDQLSEKDDLEQLQVLLQSKVE